jgi:hypothetical protein
MQEAATPAISGLAENPAFQPVLQSTTMAGEGPTITGR